MLALADFLVGNFVLSKEGIFTKFAANVSY